MLVHEILRVKQPDVFSVLLQLFGIKEEYLQSVPGELGWFDHEWEMVHDSEGRYLNYSARGWKL